MQEPWKPAPRGREGALPPGAVPVTRPGSLRQVIDGGYCVGCGACAGLDPRIGIGFDAERRLVARLPEDGEPAEAATAACPFTGAGPDEDALAQALFSGPDIVEDVRIGRHIACHAGWVEEDDIRARGSSGGVATWLQRELLARGAVDAIVDVAAREGGGDAPIFSFTVARTPEEVLRNAKTRYYPVEMSGVIRYMIDTPGRYAAIGTPCFVKALRLAAHQSPELAERLTFVLGIVCGHIKSAGFAEALAWQCGIDPDGIASIDFRAKLEDRPASRYGVSVTGRSLEDGECTTVLRPMEGLIGANWGHGLFKYRACEFCDDVLAETADAVMGDAWLPAYDGDHRGTNVVVVRHPLLAMMLTEARDAGRLHLDDLAADAVAASQAGGLRHRRDGLAYRLWLTDRADEWRPAKRVAAGRRHLSPAMRRIHGERFTLGQISHAIWRDARRSGDLAEFARRMNPRIARYDRRMKPGLLVRLLRRIERHFDALMFRTGLRR